MFDQRHVCATTGWIGSTQVLSLYIEDGVRSVTRTLSDGPPTIHTPGGRDHYIKGWVQRRTNRMVFYGVQVNNSSNIGLREYFPHLTRVKDVICFSRPLYTLIILTLAFLMFRSYYFSKEKSLSTGAPSSGLVLLRRYETPPNVWEKIGSRVQLTLPTYRSCLYSCQHVCHSIG